MATIKKFAIAVLVLSLLLFVILFGQLPALRRVPIHSTRLSGLTNDSLGEVPSAY